MPKYSHTVRGFKADGESLPMAAPDKEHAMALVFAMLNRGYVRVEVSERIGESEVFHLEDIFYVDR